MNIVKSIKGNEIIKVLFAITSILFVLPSIIYLLKNGTVYEFDKEFCFWLNDANRKLQTLSYLLILGIMTILYCFILKKHKELFKNFKQVIIYITVISSIYLLSVSFTSSDVFYYLGIGRIDGKYSQNPYYTTIADFVEKQENIKQLEKDTVLMQGYQNYWSDTTVVYGPIWTVICKGVAILSFGNIDAGIFVFRLVNILIHILNCYLIYRISNKKLFSVMYGLNPYMLIEGIMNIHNDMFVVCFVLLGIYFLVKKKKLKMALTFLAIATAIKYFTILLLPMFILYHFRKETILKRIGRCIQYGLFFCMVLIIPYLFYIRDFNVLAGIFTQQNKFSKSFYIVILQCFNNAIILDTIKVSLLITFICIYMLRCLVLLSQNKIKFHKIAKENEYFLIAFLFLLITNFQPWYIMWLFPLIMWQKPKNIKLIIQISLISQFANSIFMAYTEDWKNGTPFTLCMIIGTIICICINNKKKKEKIA